MTKQYSIVSKNKEKIKQLKAELKRYKRAFEETICYFDSISDEEQPKLAKKLKRLGV